MLNLSITNLNDHPLLLFAGGGSRTRQSRLKRFVEWQLQFQDPWYVPDLARWRDHLLFVETASASTARAYLSTVRSAYRQLLRDNQVRNLLYNNLPDDMPPERKYALISEFFIQLKNALDPDNAPVSMIAIQDVDERDHYWLTPTQAAMLMQAPGLDTWLGLRDTALIALMLCTGIRAAEAVALNVVDLRARLGATLALRIRAGKGLKQRLIPYGAQDWGLTFVDAWLETIQQITGPVFVGLRKGDNLYRDDQGNPIRLAVNGVGTALRRYPISIDGELTTIEPHDLRRTYARRLYMVGTDLTAIQQNMGHDNQQTTLDYIGTLDGDYRAPDDAYGTVWLQPLWEQLASIRKHVAPVAVTMHAEDTRFHPETAEGIDADALSAPEVQSVPPYPIRAIPRDDNLRRHLKDIRAYQAMFEYAAAEYLKRHGQHWSWTAIDQSDNHRFLLDKDDNSFGLGDDREEIVANLARFIETGVTNKDVYLIPEQPLPADKQILIIELWLRVENNSKFVRGKTRSRQEIEQRILREYNMIKPRADGWEYILFIPYETDDELNQIIERDILRAAWLIADLRNGFIEADVRALDGSERYW